jgi:hypothetical protein
LQEEGELRDTVRIRLGSSSSFFAVVDFGKHLTCTCTSTLNLNSLEEKTTNSQPV